MAGQHCPCRRLRLGDWPSGFPTISTKEKGAQIAQLVERLTEKPGEINTDDG